MILLVGYVGCVEDSYYVEDSILIL